MFSEKERLLLNEANLTTSLLDNGLISISNANIYNQGLYYQAFFSLSIGIERALKIILINSYRVDHDENFPEDLSLKDYRHGLINLLDVANIPLNKESIHYQILEFLNDFAEKTRYYNLDFMSNKKNTNNDPLKKWAEIEKRIVSMIPKNEINNKKVLANMLNEFSDVKYYDNKGSLINNFNGILDNYENASLTQIYSAFYVFELIKIIVHKIYELEKENYMMPVLSEVFSNYLE